MVRGPLSPLRPRRRRSPGLAGGALHGFGPAASHHDSLLTRPRVRPGDGRTRRRWSLTRDFSTSSACSTPTCAPSTPPPNASHALRSLRAGRTSLRALAAAGAQVDGRQKVMYAITAIKGIGRRLSNVACKKAEVDLAKRAGELSASELESLMVVVSNPRQFRVPDWFLNRRVAAAGSDVCVCDGGRAGGAALRKPEGPPPPPPWRQRRRRALAGDTRATGERTGCLRAAIPCPATTGRRTSRTAASRRWCPTRWTPKSARCGRPLAPPPCRPRRPPYTHLPPGQRHACVPSGDPAAAASRTSSA